MSLENKLLEFADNVFLRFLLSKYDCEELTYILPGFGDIPIFANDYESYDCEGLTVVFDRKSGNKIIIKDDYAINIRYKTVLTTIAEIKYEWKKIISKKINIFRDERKANLSD